MISDHLGDALISKHKWSHLEGNSINFFEIWAIIPVHVEVFEEVFSKIAAEMFCPPGIIAFHQSTELIVGVTAAFLPAIVTLDDLKCFFTQLIHVFINLFEELKLISYIVFILWS